MCGVGGGVRACVPACVSVRACVRMCVYARARAHLAHIMLELLSMSTLCIGFSSVADNIFHLDVHYVCYVTMFVQRFQPRGRRSTNVHEYYYFGRQMRGGKKCRFSSATIYSRLWMKGDGK